MFGFFHLSSLVVTFLPWLSISNQNVFICLEPAFSNTNFHTEDQNIVDGICQKGFFHEFPLDCSSRDRNLHQYHRQMKLIYLHSICIECIHTWLQWVPLPPLLQRNFVWLHVKMKTPPSGRHSCTEKREFNKALPSHKALEHWEHMPCPAQTFSSTLLFRDRKRRQEDAGKKKRSLCLFAIASWLTFYLARACCTQFTQYDEGTVHLSPHVFLGYPHWN